MAKVTIAEGEKRIYNEMKENHKNQFKKCKEKDKEGLIHKIKRQFINTTKNMEYVEKTFRDYLAEITEEDTEKK